MVSEFELDGTPETGSLLLTTPFGSAIAQMQWTPELSTLKANGSVHHYASLSAMVQHASGLDLPVASLFDWLRGLPTPTPDWSVDLTEIARGKITGRRATLNGDSAEFRVILPSEN
jgi:outer membrane lipoprotein LolB